MSRPLFQFVAFCIGWYELKYDFKFHNLNKYRQNKKWCHTPTFSLEIYEIFNIFCFTNCQLPLGNFVWTTLLAVLSSVNPCWSCHSAANTWEVMKQNIATSFPTPYITNSDITVASSMKSYPEKWCHTPTLSLDISKIFSIFYFY